MAQLKDRPRPGRVERICSILETQLADTVKARNIRSDGRSERIRAEGAAPLRSQECLYEAAAAS